MGGGHTVKVRLREDMILLCSALTSDVFVPLTEALFRDREKRNRVRLLLSKWPRLSQEEREVYLVLEFGKMGYRLRLKQGDGGGDCCSGGG